MNHREDADPEKQGQITWRKSSFSNGTGGNCIEVALLDGSPEAEHKTGLGPLIAIRDSKNPDGAKLYFTRAEFAAFRQGIIAGEFEELG
ncbi:DUF397 domain-containing protein [Nonomuraea sp. NPDC046802]|uniref:DUF397 domain-containing protein n=1 Tax=Nonomuraea sp. NPDC046802 TaxID=3154919 RepID=UPI0033F54B51